MFSADLGVTPTAAAPTNDPNFKQVALLLHGDGTNGAQNNTFIDSSSNNFTITRTGNVAQGTFSPYGDLWSNYFDGNGDYLATSKTPCTTLSSGTSGNYTVEAWVYLTKAPTGMTYSTIAPIVVGGSGTYGGSLGLWQLWGIGSTGYLSVSRDGNTYITVNATTPALNTWNHVAFVNVGTTITVYLNGVSVGTMSSTGTWATGATATYVAGDGYIEFGGYISNLRMVAGTAVYTSNFTPSTSPLTAISGTSLLTCQSNRFKDNSSNNFTITRNGDTKVTAFSPFAPSAAYSASTNGGSGYFDGSGDYLSIANNSAFNLGSSDFTVECWVYLTAYSASYSGNYSAVLVAKDASGAREWLFSISGTASSFTALSFVGFTNNTTFDSVSGSYSFALNTWYHVAATRSGNTLRAFVNGTIVGTNSSYTTTCQTTSTAVTVGAENYGSGFYYYTNGYITDARLVKGTAVYTANFTPPTAPLTAITNTQLLLNCTNAGIIDNAGKNDIETVGNAQISTSVKKYGTGSMYFDGSGDRLYSAFNGDIGSGDFTLEAWIYPTTINNNHGILATSNIDTGSWVFGLNSSGNLRWFANATSNTVNLNKWNHIVACRASGIIRLFINGILGATISDTTNYFQSPFVIGTERSLTIDYFGYIDDLRITKGQALYTSNFTPPTQAFPNV